MPTDAQQAAGAGRPAEPRRARAYNHSMWLRVPIAMGELLGKPGAGGRTRTDDLLITNQLLYQLSYAGRLVGSRRNSDVES